MAGLHMILVHDPKVVNAKFDARQIMEKNGKPAQNNPWGNVRVSLPNRRRILSGACKAVGNFASIAFDCVHHAPFSSGASMTTVVPLSATSISEKYELLVSLLAKYPQTIEVLPTDGIHPDDIESDPSLSPFLFVESNLGIPRKILSELYLHAVGVFKSARSSTPTRPTVVAQQNPILDKSLACLLSTSSSILLLANPSHQTALNTRKHLVQMHLIDPHAELHFMASLLSVPHYTKYAELWYHRRWLLNTIRDSLVLDGATVNSNCRLQFTSQGALQRELELVSRACELYPRNYFAWTHRLICVRSLLSDYLAGIDTIGFALILHNELTEMKGWIDRHVSDYSAIHTILALSQVAFQSGDLSLIQIIIDENIVDHAISLVQEYPAHEALWMYSWMALTTLHPQQAQLIQHFIDDFVQPLVLFQHPKTHKIENFVYASKHARHFLDKRACYNFTLS